MALGISPINDFAFAKTFARQENQAALISLLNAFLQLDSPIEQVTILNPFNYQDYATDKLTVLDVKATDALGRIFNVEMQLSVHQGLLQRIVYYGCEVYTDQLRKGDNYDALCPVFAICLLRGTIWQDNPKVHHRFVLTDKESSRQIANTLEIHTLELGWYNLVEGELKTARPADRWLFWLLNADKYDADRLQELFPELGFRVATASLVEIKGKTEDKAMYDSQEKARRDYEWAINSSRKEGLLEGEAKGKIEGLREGEVKGKIEGEIKLIRTLQSILSIAPSPADELAKQSLEELQQLTQALQERLQNRPNA